MNRKETKALRAASERIRLGFAKETDAELLTSWKNLKKQKLADNKEKTKAIGKTIQEKKVQNV